MSIHGVLSIVNSFNSCLLFCRIVESRIEEDNIINFNLLYPLNKRYTGIQGFVNFTAKAIDTGSKDQHVNSWSVKYCEFF